MKLDYSVAARGTKYSVLSTQYSASCSRPAAWARTFIALVALYAGCTTGEFPTAPVRGRVICEGKPVPHVMVFFEPLQTAKVMGRSGFAVADENGNFVLSSYGEKDGAVIGKHRVRVGPPHPEDFPNYKCACYLNSEVDLLEEVEVKKGKNEFELVLKKKTGREPPPRKDD
jgi:hypothetical protein